MAKYKLTGIHDNGTVAVIMGKPQQTVAVYRMEPQQSLRELVKKVASDVAANRPKQMRLKLGQVNEGE